MKGAVLAWITGFASKLRFPWLFALALGLFLLDLFVPDVIPFVDEILLALVTMLLGGLRRKPPGAPPGQGEPPTIDVPPAPPDEKGP